MPNGFKHVFHTFPSGLRLVAVPMPAATTATVLVLVGTGSKYETKKLKGVSHFLEHMMFKGTAKRPGMLDISRELDGIGAAYNAFTSEEMTGYFAKAAISRLDIILDVVFDIFLNSKLEQAAMDIERGPILEELKMRRDDPQQHIARLFEQLLYGDQPAGWEIGGEPETVSAMVRSDLADYFATHYIASNTVIAVAGNINPAAVIAKADRAFKHIRQAEKVTKPAVIEAQSSPGLLVFKKDTEQTYVNLGFRAYTMFDDRRYALGLAASILGGGMSSRLFDEVRSKRGLAYFIEAGQQNFTDTGYLEIASGINTAKVGEALKVILEECAKVRDGGVTEEELKRVKDRAEGLMALALERTDGMAGAYGDSVLFENRVVTPEEELAKIKAVTLDDIRTVSRDVFTDKKMNLAVIGPDADEKQYRGVLKI